MRIKLREGLGMDMVLLPDGRQFAAHYAADVPGSARFAALVPGIGMAEAAEAFGGVSPITVTNPYLGSRDYEGYTQLTDVIRVEDGVLVILEKPGGEYPAEEEL